MKIKQIILILTGTLFLLPVLTFSQQTAATSSKYISKNANEWSPLRFTQTEKNVTNGVEFFKKSSVCGNDTMIFIRIVNSNTYPVNIQW